MTTKLAAAALLIAVVAPASAAARARAAALRHERRRRHPQHPAAGLARPLERPRAGRLPGHRRPPRALERPAPALPRPDHRPAPVHRREPGGALQGRALRRRRATPSAPTARATTSRSSATTRSASRTSTRTTREGAMFGIGYATAEDRLFFMDIFRHLGRGQLSSFAGGAPANRAFDALMWSVAPYTEEELTAPDADRARAGFEEEADQLRAELSRVPRGRQPVHRRGAAGPDEDARRVRGDQRPRRARRLQARRRGRHRGRRRRDLRRRRRRGAGVGARARRRRASASAAARASACGATSARSTTPRAPTTVHRKRFPYALPPAPPRAAPRCPTAAR